MMMIGLIAATGLGYIILLPALLLSRFGKIFLRVEKKLTLTTHASFSEVERQASRSEA